MTPEANSRHGRQDGPGDRERAVGDAPLVDHSDDAGRQRQGDDDRDRQPRQHQRVAEALHRMSDTGCRIWVEMPKIPEITPLPRFPIAKLQRGIAPWDRRWRPEERPATVRSAKVSDRPGAGVRAASAPGPLKQTAEHLSSDRTRRRFDKHEDEERRRKKRQQHLTEAIDQESEIFDRSPFDQRQPSRQVDGCRAAG